MRNLCIAGLVAGLALGGPLAAQDTGAAPDTAPDTAAKPAPAATDYDAATVVARVNDTEITLGHVIAMRDRLPPQYLNLPDNVLYSGIVDQLVDQALLASEVSTSADQDPLGVRLALENERRGALAAHYIEDTVVPQVDDAAIQAAYEKQVADFKPQREFNASHILVESEDKAKELLTQIEGGADFAELAKANSTDGSAAEGGSLGWFGLGRMVPEFETAVQEMDAGEVKGPIHTQFGWHLIKLNETRESSPPPLEQVRAQIVQQLQQQALEAKLTELRDGATIERAETEIDPAAIRDDSLLSN